MALSPPHYEVLKRLFPAWEIIHPLHLKIKLDMEEKGTGDDYIKKLHAAMRKKANDMLAALERMVSEGNAPPEEVNDLKQKIGWTVGFRAGLKYRTETVCDVLQRDGYILIKEVTENETFVKIIQMELNEYLGKHDAIDIAPTLCQVSMKKIESEECMPLYSAFFEAFQDSMFPCLPIRKGQVLYNFPDKLIPDHLLENNKHGAEVRIEVNRNKKELTDSAKRQYTLPFVHSDYVHGKEREFLDRQAQFRLLHNHRYPGVSGHMLSKMSIFETTPLFGELILSDRPHGLNMFGCGAKPIMQDGYYVGKRVEASKGQILLVRYDMWHCTGTPTPVCKCDKNVTALDPRIHFALGGTWGDVNDTVLRMTEEEEYDNIQMLNLLKNFKHNVVRPRKRKMPR